MTTIERDTERLIWTSTATAALEFFSYPVDEMWRVRVVDEKDRDHQSNRSYPTPGGTLYAVKVGTFR